MKEVFPGIWKKGRQLFTASLVEGERTYAKSLLREGGKEFREWDPNKSKAAAAIMKGLKSFPIGKKTKILYLGISSGATSSFFSDIIGNDGIIYGVEIAERSIRDLNHVAEKRGNIIPILADARRPEGYSWIETVDVVYEDVASDEQSAIMLRNAEQFLKPGGYAMIAIKSRSIDVTKNPRDIYKQELAKLEAGFRVIQTLELDPYEKDHMFVLMKRKV